MTRPARVTARRAAIVLAVLAVLAAAVGVLGILVGGVSIDLVRALQFDDPPSPDHVILFRARIPRVLLAVAVGGGLAAAGAALQALLRNTLASPDVIGVSGGASVGAIFVLALGSGSGGLAVPAAAFAGAAAAIATIVRLATVRGRLHPYALLLVGVVVNTVAAAIIMLVSTMVDARQAQGVMFWLTGSLAQRSFAVVSGVLLLSLVGTAVLWTQARRLNLLALGEETAAQLGTNVDRVRRITFLGAALLVGAGVSVSGVIGFVGLVVPHCLRLVVGSDQRLLIPSSYLGGAAFLVAADLLARVVVAPTELPVGVVTALCGGPYFIYLLRRAEQASPA